MKYFSQNFTPWTQPLACWVVLSISGCLDGPSLFQQENAESSDYAMISSEIEGGVEGSYNSLISTNQVLAASGGEIDGATVSFPSGALAVDSLISLQEGSSLANNSTATDLGVSTGINSGGPAVVISSSIAIDASQKFLMSLPRSGSSLALDDTSEDARIIVIYRVYRAAEKKYYTGILTKDKISIDEKTVSFKTMYFGSYQVAISDEVIETAVESKTSAPILTKVEERKLPDPEWTIGKAKPDSQKREIKINLALANVSDVYTCSVSVYESGKAAPIFQDSTSTSKTIKELLGSGTIYTYDSPDNKKHVLGFQFSCIDINGRTVQSPRTDEVVLAAKVSNPSPSPSPTPPAPALSISGFGDPSSTPDSRRINAAADNAKTIGGSCDPSYPVNVNIDSATGPAGVFDLPCIAGSYSFTINTFGYSGDFILESVERGYGIVISQPGQPPVKTVIFQIPGGATIGLIHDETEFLGMSSSGTAVYVLANNINLSPGSTISVFDGILDGDGHSISGVQISVSDTDNFGLIKSTNTGRIGHLKLVNPSASGTVSTRANYIGFLLGYAGGCTGNCVIAGVEVSGGSMSIGGSGGINYVGGLVGFGDYDAYIYNSKVDANISIAKADKVGGLAGRHDGEIFASHSSGAISGNAIVGGLVGYSDGQISFSSSNTNVTAQLTSGNANVGGLIGQMNSPGTIDTSWASGNVNGSNTTVTNIGGLVGFLNGGILVQTFATGNISFASQMGGLVGAFYGGSINVSYASGSISNGANFCGGLIGIANGGSATISDSFSLSNVTCTANVGGLIGYLNNSFLTEPTNVAFTQSGSCTSNKAMTNCSSNVSSSHFSTTTSTYYTNVTTWQMGPVWEIVGGQPYLIGVP